MARFFAAEEVDPELILSRKVAIIGYGSQGSAQALNARDGGVDVLVGLRPGSKSRAPAEADGFPVTSTEEAVAEAEVIVFCTPDGPMAGIYRESIAPHMKTGQTLIFVHGFNIHYGLIEPAPDVNVVLVAPKGAGPGVRRTYVEGSGVPGLIAVHQDATGNAEQVALAYAWALGCARVMLMETTFREETETDLFGEQVVLCGGIPELIQAGFETLVGAGYQPEAAYFECLHETKIIVDLIYARGIAGMRAKISDTANWGGLTTGKNIVSYAVTERMREVLREIQSGKFAKEWIAEDAAGKPHLRHLEEVMRNGLLEDTGRELRTRMGMPEQNG